MGRPPSHAAADKADNRRCKKVGGDSLRHRDAPLFIAAASMSSACAPCAFSYGTHARQSVDLYHPTANTFANTFPLLIWVHGGGWREGSKADVPASILALRAEGFAVASVGYRLSSETSSGPFIHYPAQSVDVGAAVSWLRTSPNVTSHRLDPSRFIVAGFSAGPRRL